MKGILQQDLYRYEGERSRRWLTRMKYKIFIPGFRYIYFFRHASTCRFKPMRILWQMGLRMCMEVNSIQIPAGTSIGEGMRIVHWGHIVINPDAKIGRNFNISQGCLIGNAQGRHAGVPVIGDNVCMNANSVIVGGVTIGDNVLIAPGAFINFDVPSDSIVIGNPGRIIPSHRPTDKYIVYRV